MQYVWVALSVVGSLELNARVQPRSLKRMPLQIIDHIHRTFDIEELPLIAPPVVKSTQIFTIALISTETDSERNRSLKTSRHERRKIIGILCLLDTHLSS
ncbi:hypothetical protein CDAR_478841 [Caerostris darwini]|uniref:Secreted protein n=1 Tax=Caerostris darwini TaxID=1538125 RepID=A0AAV4RU44_9ARAC|nr:hypothetical protein CDAR_478841 [Caerostris darwini]